MNNKAYIYKIFNEEYEKEYLCWSVSDDWRYVINKIRNKYNTKKLKDDELNKLIKYNYHTLQIKQIDEVEYNNVIDIYYRLKYIGESDNKYFYKKITYHETDDHKYKKLVDYRISKADHFKEYKKRYYQEHKEALQKRNRENSRKYNEKMKGCMKYITDEDRKKNIEHCKNWYYKNREKVLAQRKEAYYKNKEKPKVKKEKKECKTKQIKVIYKKDIE